MPKKVESEPIADDEWLYRRVHRDRFRHEKAPFVSPGAFEPRTKGEAQDTDGISFYRADCVDSPAEILAMMDDPEKRKAVGIVQISAAEIRSIGLTVVSTPRGEIRGHVSIPELSTGNFKDKLQRGKCKEWMHQLAVLASPAARIVLTPKR